MKTNKNYAPFGTSVKRFGIITVHPNLDQSGLYIKRPDGCDPCLYTPKPLQKIFEVNKNRKNIKDPWKYKSEQEEWAKNLGYRNQKVLENRQWQKSLLGPIWHEISDPVKYEPACKNVGFGRTPRFITPNNQIPGPGTYCKLIPFKAPNGPHSTKPSFDREESCRFKDSSPKCSLAPNRYTIIDNESIEQKPKKLISLRGPYDLFTGRRDSSTIKNHFNTSMKCTAATWPVAFKGSFETYKKSYLGVMNKTNRNVRYRGRNALFTLAMCVRNPEEPGPAHYIIEKKTLQQNKYGFNSSYDKPPGYQRVIVWPGVGRYSAKNVTCGILGQGHRHVFLSKQKRTIGACIPQPMNCF